MTRHGNQCRRRRRDKNHESASPSRTPDAEETSALGGPARTCAGAQKTKQPTQKQQKNKITNPIPPEPAR